MLSAYSSDDLEGEAEGGFVCGFEEGLEGFFQILAFGNMPKVKHLTHFNYQGR